MPWYCLEIKYETAGGETRIERRKNLSGKELMKLREMIYDVGLFIPDPDCPATEGTIVSPYKIGNIDVTMQDKKFE